MRHPVRRVGRFAGRRTGGGGFARAVASKYLKGLPQRTTEEKKAAFHFVNEQRRRLALACSAEAEELRRDGWARQVRERIAREGQRLGGHGKARNATGPVQFLARCRLQPAWSSRRLTAPPVDGRVEGFSWQRMPIQSRSRLQFVIGMRSGLATGRLGPQASPP